MNDNELDKLLKSAAPPGRPEEYWRAFPKKVTAKLYWREQAAGASAQTRPARSSALSFAWAAGAMALLLVIGLVVKLQIGSGATAVAGKTAGGDQFAEARKCYQELEALFPHQLAAIVFDQQGPHLLLAPNPDVPSGTPLYVKVCGPKGCQSFVTFSGQEIPVNGENCEVLSNGSGEVLLVGNHRVWTGNDTGAATHIEARML